MLYSNKWVDISNHQIVLLNDGIQHDGILLQSTGLPPAAFNAGGSISRFERMKHTMSKRDQKPKEQQNAEDKIGVIGVIGIILCILLVPILLMNVTMIVKGFVNPGKVPTVGGYAPLIVLTDSMYPDIKSGDLIIVKSIDAESVREGDVIAFFDPDGSGLSVLTHRVVEITEEDGVLAFRTKGDANNAEDPSLAPGENLIGIYQTKINGAGDVAMFLQSTPGLVVCVAVPLALLVAFELIRRRKYEKSKNADTQALLAELEALRAKQAESEKKEEPKPEEPGQN